MARSVRASAADAATRAGFGLAAGLAGAVGLFCFSRSSLTLLERNMDPAEAWAVLGGCLQCGRRHPLLRCHQAAPRLTLTRAHRLTPATPTAA